MIKGLKGPIALGTIRTSLVLGLRLVIQAGTLLLVLSTLGPRGFGTYAGLGSMAVLLGTLANFGTHLTLLRDISRDSIDMGEGLRRALGTTAFCGVVLLSAYMVLAQTLLSVPPELYWVTLFLGVAELIFQPFLVIAAMERHGRGGVARSQAMLLLPLLFRLLAILMVAGFSPENSLEWYALGHLIAAILPLCFVLWRASDPWYSPSSWRVARPSEWKELTGYAVMGASASGVAELDKVLAARLLGFDAAGIYSAASRIVGSLVMPVIAMMLTAMPRLFRDRSLAGRKLQRCLFTFAGIYGIGAAIIVAVIATWIELLLGTAYTGVGGVISLLAFAVPAVSVRAAATNILTTLERPWARIFLELVGWLVIGVLGSVLARFYDIAGLAFAIILTEWMLAACSVVLIRQFSASLHSPN